MEVLAETDALRDEFLERLKKEEGNPVIEGAELGRLETAIQEYYDLALGTSTRMIGDETGEDLTLALERMQASYNDLKETLQSNTTRAEEAMATGFASTRENQRNSMIGVVAIILFAVFLLGGLSIRLARQIASPIVSLAAVAEQIASEDMAALASEARLMAEGDLTREMRLARRQIRVETGDEVGRMAASFNLMLGKLTEISDAFNLVSSGLRDLVLHVQGAADEVAAGSDIVVSSTGAAARGNDSAVEAVEGITAAIHEISANIQSVARSAHSQASSSVETVASIESMVRSVQTVAQATERLINIANDANQAVTEGQHAMTSTTEAMGEIRNVIRSSAGYVQDLGGMAASIDKIVGVIDEIAEQTNLLALNAAIEAARAGEHGLGFAVVAEEVWKLAERSAKSTGEISDLVHGIQDKVGKAVRNMEESTTTVDDGMKRTDELKTTLTKISSVVSEVSHCSQEIGAATAEHSSGTQQLEQAAARLSELTQEISAATEEQSTGTEQVVKSIEQIRDMVQENAAVSGSSLPRPKSSHDRPSK